MSSSGHVTSPQRNHRFGQHYLQSFQGHNRNPLNRRWSLDNISDTEGYVKDLRKLHLHHVGLASIRDEEYPFMLTEQDGNPVKAEDETQSQASRMFSPKVGNRLLTPRHRSGSVEFPRSLSGLSPAKGKLSNPSQSVDISVVPEERELPSSLPSSSLTSPYGATNTTNVPKTIVETKLGGSKTFLRERSSSLPRILPPIIDQDDQGMGDDVQNDPDAMAVSTADCLDRQSQVVVREMQKFVCKHASDVSQFLPLPIPPNSKYQSRILQQQQNYQATSQRKSSSPSLSSTMTTPLLALTDSSCCSVMTTLAKLHSIMYSIRQTYPMVYADFLKSLNLVSPHPILRDESLLDSLIGQLGAYRELKISKQRVRKQVSNLLSAAALPFGVIGHGNARKDAIVLKKAEHGETRVSSVRLSSLINSYLGSPLVDIYVFLYDWIQNRVIDSDMAKMISKGMTEYVKQFNECCNLLSIMTFSLTQEVVLDDFITFCTSGIITAALFRYSDGALANIPEIKNVLKKSIELCDSLKKEQKLLKEGMNH